MPVYMVPCNCIQLQVPTEGTMGARTLYLYQVWSSALLLNLLCLTCKPSEAAALGNVTCAIFISDVPGGFSGRFLFYTIAILAGSRRPSGMLPIIKDYGGRYEWF